MMVSTELSCMTLKTTTDALILNFWNTEKPRTPQLMIYGKRPSKLPGETDKENGMMNDRCLYEMNNLISIIGIYNSR